MDAARTAVVRLLMRCEEQGYSNLLLNGALGEHGFSAEQKQFITALFYGTLERRRSLDARLDLFLKKPCARLDAPVRAILRSGLYQCLYMDGVPAYAAVNAAVELTKHFRKASAAGMVNAVLRRAAAGGRLPVFTDERQRLAVTYNVSDEIAAMLMRAYPARCEEILAGFAGLSPIVLRVNTLLTTAEELRLSLEKEGFLTKLTAVPAALELLSGGNVTASRSFAEGLFHVQGAASQIAARTLGVRPGETVLDLCAAPGGKSLLLAEEMENRGTLLCNELQPNRLSLIEEQLRRCHVTCAELHNGDAAFFEESYPAADAVLCDVPCSGTGILAKKPEIRYKDLRGSAELVRLQKSILATAARYVKDGGRLVYSTCSLDPAENGEVLRDFLTSHSEFTAFPVETYGLPSLGQAEGVTFLPLEGKSDGFYVAGLKKRPSCAIMTK